MHPIQPLDQWLPTHIYSGDLLQIRICQITWDHVTGRTDFNSEAQCKEMCLLVNDWHTLGLQDYNTSQKKKQKKKPSSWRQQSWRVHQQCCICPTDRPLYLESLSLKNRKSIIMMSPEKKATFLFKLHVCDSWSLALSSEFQFIWKSPLFPLRNRILCSDGSKIARRCKHHVCRKPDGCSIQTPLIQESRDCVIKPKRRLWLLPKVLRMGTDVNSAV